MDKNYYIGGEELTPEQRESVKKFQDEQDAKTKDLVEKQQHQAKEKKMVTLEQLLQTRLAPREDRVIVWSDEVESVTEGGIHKPQEVIDKERPLFGTVIAVGPGKKVEEKVTHVLLLNLLQFGSDIQKEDLDKLKEEIVIADTSLYVGQRILYGRFAGTPVEDPDTKTPLLIMRPDDIFAEIKSDQA